MFIINRITSYLVIPPLYTNIYKRLCILHCIFQYVSTTECKRAAPVFTALLKRMGGRLPYDEGEEEEFGVVQLTMQPLECAVSAGSPLHTTADLFGFFLNFN